MNAKRSIPGTKLFVLDTNVLMHDPTCFYRFQEHDIFVPMMTLEELDANKKGLSEVARNARQASRILDEIVSGCENEIKQGIALAGASRDLATGRLYFQTEAMNGTLPASLPSNRGDNQILAVIIYLRDAHRDRTVILVSKDINMRIKCRALGLAAQDYFNDKVLEDNDLLYTGALELPPDFWEQHDQDMKSWKEDGRTLYEVTGPLCPDMLTNQFVFLNDNTERPFEAIVRSGGGKKAILASLTDHRHPKYAVWGITARNREQNFALNLLMDPEIDFVTLLGQAGTGKTLLTLAAGLTQTLEARVYSEIIITRVTVPVGEDIGFLPGTEEEKMTPWMGAIEDNLEVLHKPLPDNAEKSPASGSASSAGYGGEWGRTTTLDYLKTRIKIKSMNFMRGRTFINKFLIIDEAQNLTPKQMKTLITRAGPGTKVVCLGNIAQIDTPYLTEGSSGITYAVDRFKGWAHSGHITLQRGERSRLADHAADVL